MLTNIFPAAVFTAATTAPATSSAASVAWAALQIAGRHPFWVIFLILAPLLLLIGRVFARNLAEVRAITGAERAIREHNRGVAARRAEEGAHAENEAPPTCQSCRHLPATKALVYPDGAAFYLCDGCITAGIEIADRHPVTTGGAA